MPNCSKSVSNRLHRLVLGDKVGMGAGTLANAKSQATWVYITVKAIVCNDAAK